MGGIECYIERSADLTDPLEDPEKMSLLTETRRAKIQKYRAAEDRKRGFCAGLMITEHLRAHGRSPEEIRYTEHSRPYLLGLDFNISHSGEYVIMALSDAPVGCDIERIRPGKDSIAERFFSAAEVAWIRAAEDPVRSFTRIWTARESYVKYKGEGISLDFRQYEVQNAAVKGEPPQVKGDLSEVPYLGAAEIIREGIHQDCEVHQWLYAGEYVISLCADFSGEVDCFE